MATGKKFRLSSLFAIGSNPEDSTNDKSLPPISAAPRNLSQSAAFNQFAVPNSPYDNFPGHYRNAAAGQLHPHSTYSPPAGVTSGTHTVSRKPISRATSTENFTVPQAAPASIRYVSMTSSPVGSRPPSTQTFSSRPTTPVPHLMIPSTDQSSPESGGDKAKRKSWWSKGKKGAEDSGPEAWILDDHGQAPYSIASLVEAYQVNPSGHGPWLGDAKKPQTPELWDESGNTFVYLYPRTSGRGPSFRVHSSVYAASSVLRDLAGGDVVLEHDLRTHSRSPSAIFSSPPLTPPPFTPERRDYLGDGSNNSLPNNRLHSDSFGSDAGKLAHLYSPITLSTDQAIPQPGQPAELSPSDIDHLMAVRNTFAFLTGASLVATQRKPTAFDVFLQVSHVLKHFGFSNVDGSTFGDVANAKFDKYAEETALADVRASRQKTIEAIVLGERMRSAMLYNEGFVHAAGKYDYIMKLKSTKYQLISPATQSRIERASMDLSLKEQNIEVRLLEFDFPAIFAGLMSSKTDGARKVVNFETWRTSYNSTRRFLVNFYKHKYGSWPPKASSKKNNLETSGLNRIVLRDLYHDLSSVYDLLVNRESPTTRDFDGVQDDPGTQSEPFSLILRRVLHEYDASTPPVQPAVPYDVPIFPSLAMTRSDYGLDGTKDAKVRRKKIKDDELRTLLLRSTNPDCHDVSTPFLDAFRDFEHRAWSGKTVTDMCDTRCGAWLFLYAVLQALPMLVVDAPGVKWTAGVEYFLCQPPRAGVPWVRLGSARSWYGVAGGGVVALPPDAVEHGIEGVYQRSHCWQMAARWSGEPLRRRPPGVFGGGATAAGSSRPVSPYSAYSSRRSSVVDFGLQELSLSGPGGAPRTPSPGLRPPVVNASKTFDAILGASQPVKGKRKKKM